MTEELLQFHNSSCKTQNMWKHERSTYKAGRTTAIANQLNRKQQKKEDQSKASFMDAKQVKRKAFPKEYPEFCIEWLSRPPGVAGSNMFCLPLSSTEECCGCRGVRAGFMPVLLAWVPDRMNVSTLLLGSKSRDNINTFSLLWTPENNLSLSCSNRFLHLAYTDVSRPHSSCNKEHSTWRRPVVQYWSCSPQSQHAWFADVLPLMDCAHLD